MEEFVMILNWSLLAYGTLEAVAVLGRIIRRASDEVSTGGDDD